MQCMSVDLPEPDGPITAVNSPPVNATDMLSSAVTRVSPHPYTFVTPSARAAVLLIRKVLSEGICAGWFPVCVANHDTRPRFVAQTTMLGVPDAGTRANGRHRVIIPDPRLRPAVCP